MEYEDTIFHGNYVRYNPLQPHRHFAGLIYATDFSNESPLYPGEAASRIESDLRFDHFCRVLSNERARKWKK